jgi:signal transduction histidine kinase/ActR/RegA family two-component response regulator
VFTRNRKENDRNGAGGAGSGQSLSLLRLARAGGTNHAEWIHQAIQELRDKAGVERVGVWLEESRSAAGDSGTLVFYGEVWERGTESGPPGWARLSENALLPRELLQDGKIHECDLDGSKATLIMGPLMGLGRALWVPITVKNILRGMVMLGSRAARVPLPRTQAEKIAEELGVLLELQESRRVAAAWKADLELERRVQGLLREGRDGDHILAQLLENCTRSETLGGVGTAFAMLGERIENEHATSLPAKEEELWIRAHSGGGGWKHTVVSGPLESLWRQAIEQHQVVGTEVDRGGIGNEKLRIVAVPVSHGARLCGVLLAGLPRHKAKLESLDRLELRAFLMAEVLEQERRAESTARQERWYRAMLESSEQAFVLVERDGLVRGMSRGAREILRDEMVADNGSTHTARLADFFQPQDGERVQQWLGDQANHTEDFRVEVELRNGHAVKLSRMALSGEEFLAVKLETAQPATARKVEEELRQAIEWLEEGVVIFDENEQILARNGRFLQILGVNAKLCETPRNLEEVIREVSGNFADPQFFGEQWRALARSEDRTQQELAMEQPVPQVIERCTRPIVTAAGKKLGRVEVYREVTARRMFQSRMIQAEKLAALGQRATAILHELSNPLTSILGNAQRMVLRAAEGTPLNEAHRILEEAERAKGILRQLLHLAREARPERRLISLNELVQHAVDLQRASLAGTALRLQVDTTEHLPRIEGDTAQLQQVLLNLLQNAQQAIEQTGGRGTISVRTSSVAPDRVRLEVWDDGPGIPEAIQARIFDPFFTTKPDGVGTGLGLAIVNGFVRQHGGSISVFSPPGGGARFVVDLPTAEGKRVTDAAPHQQNPVEPLTVPAVGAAGTEIVRSLGADEVSRVLVVEDETIVANLIADVLRDEGMRVDVLLDGQKALEAARSSHYDLAICDLNMPEMDGRVLFNKLQQEENPLREHILFVTGDVLAQRTHDFLERNHLPHVAKPFRVEELSEAVRRMLRGGTRAAAAGAKSVENGIGP